MKMLKATAINKHSNQDDRGMRKLNAKLIYLYGDALVIKRLGHFFLECSEQMQARGPFHRHFRDFVRRWDESMLDVVVERSITKTNKRHNKRLVGRRDRGENL